MNIFLSYEFDYLSLRHVFKLTYVILPKHFSKIDLKSEKSIVNREDSVYYSLDCNNLNRFFVKFIALLF